MLRLVPALAASFVLAVLAAAPRADDKPADKDESTAAAPAGTWKVFLPTLQEAASRPLWLVKLEKKDSGWSGEVLATADRFPKGKAVRKVAVAGGVLRFTLETQRHPAAVRDQAAEGRQGGEALRHDEHGEEGCPGGAGEDGADQPRPVRAAQGGAGEAAAGAGSGADGAASAESGGRRRRRSRPRSAPGRRRRSSRRSCTAPPGSATSSCAWRKRS